MLSRYEFEARTTSDEQVLRAKTSFFRTQARKIKFFAHLVQQLNTFVYFITNQ